jgi:F420-non-reducing hydrogenase large subunit
MAFFVTDHTTHFYALGGPDFIVGPDAPPAERNLLGVARKVGPEIARAVIDCRARNHRVIEMLGGRGIHPVAGVPGGWSKSVAEAEREECERVARENVSFAQFSLEIFDRLVWSHAGYREMVESDVYSEPMYYMGTVDEWNRPNFYSGRIRIVDPEGREHARYAAADYRDHVEERSEPWTYMKFPFLKQVGWKGLRSGADSGVYCATPLSRLNVADRMPTPRAQAEFERFFGALGGRPVHRALATHWARLIELLYAAERMLELATDPEVTSTEVRAMPRRIEGEGVGSVEAPRGTLIHHYETDAAGLIRKVNLIVGTTNNHAAISMAVRRAAERLIRSGRVVEEGILNRIEMAFRLYDPCLSCATHSLPGAMPLIVRVRDASGQVVTTLRRDG